MADRTVSEAELRENARLAAADVVEYIYKDFKTFSPERMESFANLLSALDGVATEPA